MNHEKKLKKIEKQEEQQKQMQDTSCEKRVHHKDTEKSKDAGFPVGAWNDKMGGGVGEVTELLLPAFRYRNDTVFQEQII
ncbi:MAG: hypothetical protein H8E46_04310 [FCB group bacterium]|nr:hypothetical protein [FCB group bacterium]